MSLAMRYGYDMNKAELAGLMHDCGKRYSDEVILKKCLKHGIPVSESENKALAVLQDVYKRQAQTLALLQEAYPEHTF